MSMAAALDDLAQTSSGRRVAVLGDMLELGPRTLEFHRAVGEHAAAQGIEVLVTVGDLAAAMGEGFSGEAHSVSDARAAGGLLRDGDTVLVKGSRGVGLERVADAVGARADGAPSAVTPHAGTRGAPQAGTRGAPQAGTRGAPQAAGRGAPHAGPIAAGREP